MPAAETARWHERRWEMTVIFGLIAPGGAAGLLVGDLAAFRLLLADAIAANDGGVIRGPALVAARLARCFDANCKID
jgi:hypothetical protein